MVIVILKSLYGRSFVVDILLLILFPFCLIFPPFLTLFQSLVNFGVTLTHAPFVTPSHLLPAIESTGTWATVVVDSPRARCTLPDAAVIAGIREALKASFDVNTMLQPQLLVLGEDGAGVNMVSAKDHGEYARDRIVGILFPRRSVAVAAIKALPEEKEPQGSIVSALLTLLLAAKS